MIYTAASLVVGLLVFTSTSIGVDGHGHMTSPRSRNWFAHEDGVDGTSTVGLPPRDYCPHCLNVNHGVCGYTDYNDYDNYLDSTGNPMPWLSQGTYTEGQLILVKSYLDTHHNGHMTLTACADGPASTQECFDAPGHELTFVSDPLFGMPPDPNYPGRGYYAGGQGGGVKDFKMLFQLPPGIHGDQVMLQWKYITANSCSPPGYAEYFNANPVLPSGTSTTSYWTAGLGECTPPYPADGTRGTTWPEQFFNCAEITVNAAAGPTTPTAAPPTSAPPPTNILAPTNPGTAPTTASPPTAAAPTNAPGTGCCSGDFKNCNEQLVGWCSESEANCVGPCDQFWLPNGAITGSCMARYEPCAIDSDCCSPGVCIFGMCELDTNPLEPTPTAPSPTAAAPTQTAQPSNYCCSNNFQDCISWCGTTQSECENCNQDVWWIAEPQETCLAMYEDCTSNQGGCCSGLTCVVDNPYYSQCRYEASAPTIAPPPTATPAPVNPPAPTTGAPTKSPTAPLPTTTPEPTFLYSCSEGIGSTSWEALLDMEAITYKVSATPYVLSVVASGGAAGDGSDVVSESQAYGVLAAALTLMSMKEGDVHYDEAKRKFEGYFNGWREMCRNSAPPPCQNPTYCDGGSSPCLPGWKHRADFSSIVGTGSAPDGDEDAIVGMIIALKATETDSVRPSWYDEVHDWADRSCTQFLQDNTKLSSSGSHRILKLGSCWGGWGSEGNNPSYHAPGHFRMMRDFQASVQGRAYALPAFVNSASWNMLIDTSYKFLDIIQCPDTGLVPNWALVREVDSQTLAKDNGSFSGSGTPQYEFGAEASRTMWRVAFDAAAYPEESAAQSEAFLAPLHDRLVTSFDPSPLNGWEHFGQASLEACSPVVSNVFGSWQWNKFISAPVYSTLVGGITTDRFTGKSFDQQTMVDEACLKTSDTANESYYPLSWQVLAKLTLNGEVARAGALFN